MGATPAQLACYTCTGFPLPKPREVPKRICVVKHQDMNFDNKDNDHSRLKFKKHTD